MEEAELRARMLELLRTDEEFRLAVAGLLGLDEVLKAIRALQEQVAWLRGDFKSLSVQMAKNTETIRFLQEQVARNTEAIRALQEQVVALQEQVAENTRAIRALQKQVVELREDFKALSAQVAENTEAIRALQEQVADNSRAIRELREDMNRGFKRYDEELAKLRKDMIEGFRRHDEELARLREDMNKGFKRYDEELARLRADMHEGFELLRRHIDALGARWGLLAEEAFRKGMKGVVERYFGGQVERWTYRDEEGFVFGRPSEVEADLLITDREHILMEIKSSVSRADVFELWRIGQLYERVVGVKPRLAVVSPFVREEAKKVAEELGIEVYTSL